MIKTSKLVAVMTTFNEQVRSLTYSIDNDIDNLSEMVEDDINEQVVFYLKMKCAYNILTAMFDALSKQTGGFPEPVEKIIKDSTPCNDEEGDEN